MDKQIIRSQDIIRESLHTVFERYGEDSADNVTIPTHGHRAYHNLEHSLDVYNRSTRLASTMGLSTYDQAIIGMAAAAHDVIQEGERGQMEADSADWLADRMSSAGFPKPDIIVARLAIFGTEPILENGRMIGQRVSGLRSESPVPDIIACADMGGMYRPDGPRRGHDIYVEDCTKRGAAPQTMEGFVTFQQFSLDLARTFRFSRHWGEAAFAVRRPEVIQHQKAMLDDLESGRMTDWSEVAARDAQFEAVARNQSFERP